jgi:hypothetical protein
MVDNDFYISSRIRIVQQKQKRTICLATNLQISVATTSTIRVLVASTALDSSVVEPTGRCDHVTTSLSHCLRRMTMRWSLSRVQRKQACTADKVLGLPNEVTVRTRFQRSLGTFLMPSSPSTLVMH